MPFKSAKRMKMRNRVAIIGPSGSGKTLAALRIGYGLCQDWSKVFCLDSEDESMLAYANDSIWNIGEFMHMGIKPPHTSKKYLEAFREAAAAGAAVIITDTLSHFWQGRGGILEQHNQMKGNSFTNWGEINPDYYDVVDWLIYDCPCDVIVTYRAKTQYVLSEIEENGRKKTVVDRMGMGPIARPNSEYEYLLVVELDRSTHVAEIITQRGSMFPDSPKRITLNEETGKRLRVWADSGEEQVMTDAEQWISAMRRLGATKKQVESALGVSRVSEWLAQDQSRTIKDAIAVVVREMFPDDKSTSGNPNGGEVLVDSHLQPEPEYAPVPESA